MFGGTPERPWNHKKKRSFMYPNIDVPRELQTGRYRSHVPPLKLLRESRLLKVEELAGHILAYKLEETAPVQGQPVYRFTVLSVVPITPSCPIEYVDEGLTLPPRGGSRKRLRPEARRTSDA